MREAIRLLFAEMEISEDLTEKYLEKAEVLIEALPALEHSYKMLGRDMALFDGVLADIRAKSCVCVGLWILRQ